MVVSFKVKVVKPSKATGSSHSFVPQAPPTCTPTYQPVQLNSGIGGGGAFKTGRLRSAAPAEPAAITTATAVPASKSFRMTIPLFQKRFHLYMAMRELAVAEKTHRQKSRTAKDYLQTDLHNAGSPVPACGLVPF